MNRTDAILKRLLHLHPNKLIDLKLDRVVRLLDELGRPQDKLPPVIHVAGTNGKGSTIAHLRSFLEAAGKKVHVYNSPHLVRFNERIRLAGKFVTSKRLNEALRVCEEVNARRPITYFEITTAAAFLLFSQVRADFVLLEVGLGGRFDATNVIPHPLGAILTPVSIDHVEFLGSNAAEIAHEKAGILKAGAKAVVGVQSDAGREAIEIEAQKLGVEAKYANQDFQGYLEFGRFTYQDEKGLLDLPQSALKGNFQTDNAALAIAAVRHFDLPVTDEQIATGLKNVTWPGRLMPLKRGELFDRINASQELWLDGGHNIGGAEVLADALQTMASDNKPLVLILGAYANKDMKGYLQQFKTLAPMIFTVPLLDQRQSWDPTSLTEMAKDLGLQAVAHNSIGTALDGAIKIANARILICGSLHLVGDALEQNKTPPN